MVTPPPASAAAPKAAARALPRWLAWLPLGKRRHSAAHLGSATLAVAMVLKLLQSTLDVPSGWGAEDLLGWTAAEPIAALLGIWSASHRVDVFWGYLTLDSVVFVPLYSAYALSLALMLANALADDQPARVSMTESWVLLVLAAPTLALLGIDLVENGLGLARTGDVGWGLAAVATAAAIGMLWHGAELREAWTRLPRRSGWVVVLVTLLLWLGASFGGAECGADRNAWAWRLGCGAHRAKGWLVPAMAVVLLLATAAWLFGARLQAAAFPQDTRAQLRSAIWDMFVRSRYVLVALGLVAALTVKLDQGKDVIYAVAGSALREGDFGTTQRLGLVLGSVFACAVAGLAVWALVFACWFWTRSVCQIRSARSGSAPPGVRPPDAAEDLYARYWARALGLTPVFLLALLCAGVLSDIARSQGAHGSLWIAPALAVLGFGATTVWFGVKFLRKRVEAEEDFGYDCADWRTWSTHAGLLPGQADGAKYRFAGVVTAYRLPLLLTVAMLVCRAVDVYQPVDHGGQLGIDYLPTLSFALILIEVALWLCFFGWLSIVEVHRSTPWVGILVVVAGVLGAAGWTNNHVVWPAILGGTGNEWGGLRMLCFTGLLATWLMGVYHAAMALTRRYADPAAPARWGRRDWAVAVALVAAVAALLWGADRKATSRPPAPAELASSERPSLDLALAQWLASLCKQWEGEACKETAIEPGADGAIRVHLVSTEGGGIRAAVWTALLLQHLSEADPKFTARTFSMSGVSGGAVGLAAFRACQAGSEGTPRLSPADCLKRMAGSDLLSPLLSAWMFEDVLGRVLPTSWCDTPGCGFLSRSAWFEQALENSVLREVASGEAPNTVVRSVSGLRHGLVRDRKDGPHQPYLLLNATWVESGERAIASDLAVRWEHFRGAKDQIDITGVDIPLGAAAHNAARFPFVNAIGGLQAPPLRCRARLAAPPASAGQAAESFADRDTCGHLADGGYFDNSGAQTTIDVMHALARCLDVTPRDADAELYRACRELEGKDCRVEGVGPAATLVGPDCEAQQQRKKRLWLAQRLVPQVLMIRNSVNPAAAREEACPASAGRPPRSKADVLTRDEAGDCTALSSGGYAPERPICREQASVFIDLVGPALTVLNASGVGANGQLAEARQAQAVKALRLIMGGKAAQTTVPPTQVLDLLPDGTRYPLGWHLSGFAASRMDQQAQVCAGKHR